MALDLARVHGVSLYATLNPVRRDLLARNCTGLRKAKSTTSDEDISILRWILIDADPIRPADISSTDEELERARGSRDRLLAQDPEIAASSLSGSSGNGYFLLARIPDYPNDPEHVALVEQFLASLAARYSDDQVKIDTATSNPSRISALPGTKKCKGSNVPERPHRMVTLDRAAGVPLPSHPKDDPPLRPLDLRSWLVRNPAPAPTARTKVGAKPATKPHGSAGAANTKPKSEEELEADARLAESALGVLGDRARGGYREWLEVGMSLTCLGQRGLDLWDRWSTQARDKYHGGECEAKWSGFSSGGENDLSLGSLFRWAEAAGWTRPTAAIATAADAEGSQADGSQAAPESNVQAGFPELANFRIEQVTREVGGQEQTSERIVPLLAHEIATNLRGHLDGWPKRIGATLFVTREDCQPLYLDSSTALFAHIRRYTSVNWARRQDMVPQEQFYTFLTQDPEGYDTIEMMPHSPPIPGIYYSHPDLPPPPTGKLQELVD
jgi:Primase C terminal 2 (PriCT-2)